MFHDVVQPRATGAIRPTRGERILLPSLADAPRERWASLADHAAEPNPFYAPFFALRAEAFARVPQGARALAPRQGAALAAMLPVRTAWQALRLPVPALVAWESYAPLTVPLLDEAQPMAAAEALLDAAAATGAAALYLPFLPTGRPAARALRAALVRRGLDWDILRAHDRAWLDATASDGEALLREALGAKKLKELRRQHNRLADGGAVRFTVARSPGDVSLALEHFLALEAAGWKGHRGTALACNEGDTVFARDVAVTLAARGRCEIPLLWQGDRPVAAGLVLRQDGHASFLKIAYDETLARFSPGVQLTLELTKHFCADPDIRSVDSTAIPDHPMIDHVWRGREPFGAVLLPLGDPGAGFRAVRAAILFRTEARRRAARVLHVLRQWRSKR